MLQKICFILALTSLIGSTAAHITKEILQPNPELEKQITESESLEESIIALFLQNPQEVINNLATLVSTNSNPDISDVLEAINGGIGSQIFVINDELVQVNPDAFEGVALQSARKLAKVLYPKNYMQQIVFTTMIQQRIKSAFKVARPIMVEQKIPVQAFELALKNTGDSVIQRKVAIVQQRNIITDLVSTVQLSVCNTLVGTLYNTMNATLTEYVTFLENISIATSDGNVLTTLLSTGVDTALILVQELVDYLNSIAEELSGTICTSLFSSTSTSTTNSTSTNSTTSRKRRDIDQTAVAEPLDRSLATRGIFDIFDSLWSLIWSLLSPALNAITTSLVGSYVTQLQTYMDTIIDNLAQVVYDFINSIFST